jgi:hypothetical protein
MGFLKNLIPDILRGQVKPDVLSVAPSRKVGRPRRRVSDRPNRTMAAYADMWGAAMSSNIEDAILALDRAEFNRAVHRRPIVSVDQHRALQTIQIPEIPDLRLRPPLKLTGTTAHG